MTDRKGAASRPARRTKANLPPRTLAVRRLPRWDAVAPPYDGAVAETLKCASQSELDYLELDEHLKNIGISISFYISNKDAEVDLPWFRSELRKFKQAIDGFMKSIPARNSPIGEAIWARWEITSPKERIAITEEWPEYVLDPSSLDLDSDDLLHIIVPFAVMTAELLEEESGRGPDGDRAARELVRRLARNFEECTGRSARLTMNPYAGPGEDPVSGPFGRFMKAINEGLPDGFKLGNLEHLIRTYGAYSSEASE